MEGNPPLAQERSCSTANIFPHAHSGWGPAIPEGDGIMESALVQGVAMLL